MWKTIQGWYKNKQTFSMSKTWLLRSSTIVIIIIGIMALFDKQEITPKVLKLIKHLRKKVTLHWLICYVWRDDDIT